MSNSLLLGSIIDKRHTSSKHYTSNIIQHAIFSTKPTLQKQLRIIIMGLAYDASNDFEAPMPLKIDHMF